MTHDTHAALFITTCPNCREEYARGLDPLRPEEEEWDDFPRRVGYHNAYFLGWRPRKARQDLTDGTKHAIGVLAVSGLFLVMALVVVAGLAALIGGNE